MSAETFIARYAAEHQFNGSILAQKHGKVIYSHSFGLANIPFQVSNTPQTKYKIASITKAFTSVLVLQLREAGKLDLNKTIGSYLTDYAGEGSTKVSLHQLLNHTSGLENPDSVDLDTAIKTGVPLYQTPLTSDQLLSRCCSGKLVRQPGTGFDYNNADYIVLGKILERVSGKPYEQLLKEKILDPLKMSNTGMIHQDRIVANLADTYFYRDQSKLLSNDLPFYTENWYSAGAMYSTPGDLLAFSNALFSYSLLDKASVDLMTTPGLEDYGYGVWAYDTQIAGKPHRVVKRPGRIMGAQGQLYRMVDDDITIVILSNTGTTDLDEFVSQIGKHLVD